VKRDTVDLARHALDSESRPVRWHLDIFDVDKVSLHRGVAAILDRARPVGMARGEFLVRKALGAVLAEASLRGEFLAVEADLRAFVTDDAHLRAERPLREAAEGRATAMSDGAMRELAGQKKTPR
jgi:hypothetical protein